MPLTAGSIAFTGFNGDGNDNLSFVALTDIPQGTVISFTDSNWNGTSFATGSNAESTIAWTATSAISAGTVIDINNIGKGTFGTSAGSATFTNANNTGLSNDSEVVYAYIGAATAPTFLAAISNVGYATSDGVLTGTGLVAGQTAVSFTGGLDIVGYNGPRSGFASFADYLAAIGNAANWATQNGSGDQSTDGTTPDAPFPTTAFTVAAPATQTISFSSASVSVAEGQSGTKTMTFTVLRTGGTTGAISFSGSFAAGTTNAADFGGTLPGSSFSGSIADGASSATVTITISGDTTSEDDQSFTLTLTAASNASAPVSIGTAAATGTIVNDDGVTLLTSDVVVITMADNFHLINLAGSTPHGTTPITWVGGSTTPGAIIDNFGTITGSSRAIATSGSTSGSFTINNKTGATITATKDAVKISNLVSGTSGTFTVNNEGTISSTGTGSNAGQALDLDDINSSGAHTVINNAATGVISAADADAIRPGANATINNYGQIVSHNASTSSSGNDAIDFQSVNTGGVVNNFAGGVIDGARHAITGDQPITVTNDGTIIGRGGSGINMDTAASTTTTVTNRGIITGTAVGGADADGIDVDGLVSIDNFGTIKAVGLTSAANGLNEALAIGGGFVHNEAGGLIVSDQRAITVDDSNDGSAFAAMTIINDGTIRGNNGEAISIVGTFGDIVTNTGGIFGSVATDGGNDTLTNSGSIIGDVAMGAGDDSINLATGSIVTGAIDGGDGFDTLTLSGGGTLLGAVVNIEKLDIQGGVWRIKDATGYSDIQVESGAVVVLEGSANGMVVAAGAAQAVFGLASNSVISGNQYIQIGGSADGTTIETGGEQDILGGGIASNTTVDGGTQNVFGVAIQTTIANGGIQHIHNNAFSTIVNAGGEQNVYIDGSATGSTINAGGIQIDWGFTIITTISGGGQYVFGSASLTTINSGLQAVENGGTASDTTIHGGGQEVYSGGTAINTTMDGGIQSERDRHDGPVRHAACAVRRQRGRHHDRFGCDCLCPRGRDDRRRGLRRHQCLAGAGPGVGLHRNDLRLAGR
jgi:autotransporter passenger strand-loop-strand repeat protein